MVAGDSMRAMEEERGLFNVAITRAEDNCYLSFAKMRFRYGKMEFATPSRFLKDIDPELIDLPMDSSLRKKSTDNNRDYRRERQLNEPMVRKPIFEKPAPNAGYKETVSMQSTTAPKTTVTSTGVNGLAAGQKIVHERFGKGEVITVECSGDNAKASIRFDNVGVIQLLLRFARLKIIA